MSSVKPPWTSSSVAPTVRCAPFTPARPAGLDRKSTRLNSSHDQISYAVFCLKKKKKHDRSDLHRSELQSRPDHVERLLLYDPDSGCTKTPHPADEEHYFADDQTTLVHTSARVSD